MASILKWREPVHNAVIEKRQLQFNTLISDNVELDEIFIHDVVAKEKNQRLKRKQTWEMEGSEKMEASFAQKLPRHNHSSAKKSTREYNTSDEPTTSNGANFSKKVATRGQQSSRSTPRRDSTKFYDCPADRAGEGKHTYDDTDGRERFTSDRSTEPSVGRMGVTTSYATKTNNGRTGTTFALATESDLGKTCTNAASITAHSVLEKVAETPTNENGKSTTRLGSKKESVNESGRILSELLADGSSRGVNVERPGGSSTNIESTIRESSGNGTFSSIRRPLEKQPNRIAMVLSGDFSTRRDKSFTNHKPGGCCDSSKTNNKLNLPECSMPEDNRGATQILPTGNREKSHLQGRTLSSPSSGFLQPSQPERDERARSRFTGDFGIEQKDRQQRTATATFYRISNERNPIFRAARQETAHGSSLTTLIDSPKPSSSLPSYYSAVFNRKRTEATMEIDSLVDELRATNHIYRRKSSSSSLHDSDTTYSTGNNRNSAEDDNETSEILNLFV
ncbi:Oidioi.mRNA.OKI2018_I69.chr2.g6159.t1.cds [Oikopleura dioica]|uniref:Oidioi.mRNA.OKI2018_I69.chr2.g6159.t1.cds n=1 Tax=Oikopleura dioica TaxID=34765 RepID=A0ABN7T265_OIKDI|nr:Oidioi.mRNA.OKI2018_I69.chr2.g6159.t1.cds [Oikopleura dioica]